MAREIGDLDELPTAESSFIEAGLDSLSMVSLSAQLQVEVDAATELPPTLLFDHPRINDLATFIVAVIDGGSESPKASSDPRSNIRHHADQSEPSEPDQHSHLRGEIEQMSEADALAELMKELD